MADAARDALHDQALTDVQSAFLLDSAPFEFVLGNDSLSPVDGPARGHISSETGQHFTEVSALDAQTGVEAQLYPSAWAAEGAGADTNPSDFGISPALSVIPLTTTVTSATPTGASPGIAPLETGNQENWASSGSSPDFFAADTASVSSAISASAPSTQLNTTQAGVQITRDDYHWGSTLGTSPGTITFGFRTSAPSYSASGENLAGTFSSFTAQEEATARAALALWAATANITFQDLGDTNSATIEFANYSSSTDGSEAFTYFPGNTAASAADGDVFMNTYFASTTNDGPGTYEWMTLIHEIGHSIGLEHPGDYDASSGQSITYANSATYVEDTRQYSLMSYFSESNTGGNFQVYDETPMLDDIAAVQRLYGANTTTFSGNTVFGFNSNAGTPYSITSNSQKVAFTVYDTGGNDTLDFSGYTQTQTINLNSENFSSVGGGTYNVSIAQNVLIENAIGGSGSDTIIGNAANNTIKGGAGNDTLDGGAGIDTAVFSGLHSAYTVTSLGGGSYSVSGPDGTDMLSNFEYLKFDDQTVSLNEAHVTARVLTPAGQMGPEWHVVAAADYTGDATADIMWVRNTTGDAALWTMKAATLSSFSSTQGHMGAEWSAASANADFNADGHADVLWSSNGSAAIWEMNGPSLVAAAVVSGHMGSEWNVQGAGDFNGDGRSDILWTDTQNRVDVWTMSGTLLQSASISNGSMGTEWSAKAVGKFDGSGHDGVAWVDSNTGEVALWSMNGSSVTALTTIGTAPSGYHIAGAGDFNADGHSDLVWVDGSNDVQIWEIASNQVVKTQVVDGHMGTEWQLKGVGDLTGDGVADLLWVQANGTTAIWDMGNARSAAPPPGSTPVASVPSTDTFDFANLANGPAALTGDFVTPYAALNNNASSSFDLPFAASGGHSGLDGDLLNNYGAPILQISNEIAHLTAPVHGDLIL